MMGRTHITIGMASIWVIYLFIDAPPHWLLPVVAGFFAMYSDIEADESKIKHFGTKDIKPLFIFSIIANGLFEHRGFFHSLFMGIILFIIGVFAMVYYQFSFYLLLPPYVDILVI